MKPWHSIIMLGLLLGFIEVYHIYYHSHCPVTQMEEDW